MTKQLELKKNQVTPEGQFVWNYLFEADDEKSAKNKYPSGKHSINVRFSGDEAKKMQEDIEVLTSLVLEESGADKLETNPLKEVKDKEGNIIDGMVEVKFKSANAPTVLDAKKNRIFKKNIPGYQKGSFGVGRGVVAYNPQEQTVSDKTYLSLYLQAAQLRELSQGGVDMDMFAEYDDGFAADGETYDVEAEDDIPDFAA